MDVRPVAGFHDDQGGVGQSRGIAEAVSQDLPAPFLRQLREFLDTAFDGDFADLDWAHSLGGTHVWINSADGLICHGSIVPRSITCSGHQLQAAYVEAVATAQPHRLQGHATAIMRRLGELITSHYQLGVLSTGEHAFYVKCGWQRWRGPTFFQHPDGQIEATPEDDGGIMILTTPHTPQLDLEAPIIADWRTGDVW